MLRLITLLQQCLQLPVEWITHNTVNFQPPAARTFDLASYPNVKQGGPRAEQVTEVQWTLVSDSHTQQRYLQYQY
jgi:hypothetical protein